MPTPGQGCLSLRIYSRDVRREGFAIGPDCPIFEIFLLPDGDLPLQRVDKPAAGFECCRTMCGCNRDHYARLPDLQPSQTMDDRDIANLELADRLNRQRFHLLQCHLLISL